MSQPASTSDKKTPGKKGKRGNNSNTTSATPATLISTAATDDTNSANLNTQNIISSLDTPTPTTRSRSRSADRNATPILNVITSNAFTALNSRGNNSVEQESKYDSNKFLSLENLSVRETLS